MALRIGDTAPDFTAQTTEGQIRFHEWIGDGYAILFSHPKDFTPVCTTELGQMAGMAAEFAEREREDHRHLGRSGGRPHPLEVRHPGLQRPLGRLPDDRRPRRWRSRSSTICSPRRRRAIPANRTPADNQTVRTVFVVGPDKKVKLTLTYPMTTGRSFDEILRALDSIRLTERHKVATPAGWRQGEDVIVTAAVSDEEAEARFGGFERKLPYIRTTKQPA